MPLLEKVQQTSGQVFMTATEERWPEELAREARRWIAEKFDLATSLDPLIALFRARLAADQKQSRDNCCSTQTVAAGARE